MNENVRQLWQVDRNGELTNLISGITGVFLHLYSMYKHFSCIYVNDKCIKGDFAVYFIKMGPLVTEISGVQCGGVTDKSARTRRH